MDVVRVPCGGEGAEVWDWFDLIWCEVCGMGEA